MTKKHQRIGRRLILKYLFSWNVRLLKLFGTVSTSMANKIGNVRCNFNTGMY